MARNRKLTKKMRLIQQAVEYRLTIDAFTPETLPMSRLAEYMTEFASLLGQTEHVHFVRLEKGSAQLVANVDWEAAPKVRTRVRAVKYREPNAPAEAMRAFQGIDKRLAADNASGELFEPSGKKIIQFPGRKRPEAMNYGPVRQPGTVDGVPIVIGGENDPVPVHLEDREQVYNCLARRTVARALAAHLFVTPIRANGFGTWVRSDAGVWVMERFLIQDFQPLDDAPLSTVVNRLRNIKPGWKSAEVLDDLDLLRGGDRGKVN